MLHLHEAKSISGNDRRSVREEEGGYSGLESVFECAKDPLSEGGRNVSQSEKMKA